MMWSNDAARIAGQFAALQVEYAKKTETLFALNQIHGKESFKIQIEFSFKFQIDLCRFFYETNSLNNYANDFIDGIIFGEKYITLKNGGTNPLFSVKIIYTKDIAVKGVDSERM